MREGLKYRVDCKVLKGFVHAGYVSEDRFIKRDNDSEVEGKIVRGRPCMSRLLGVKEGVQCEVAGLEGCNCESQ